MMAHSRPHLKLFTKTDECTAVQRLCSPPEDTEVTTGRLNLEFSILEFGLGAAGHLISYSFLEKRCVTQTFTLKVPREQR